MDFIKSLKLPYGVQLQRDQYARPEGKRYEGWAKLDKKLGPDTTVTSVSFITDVSEDGTDNLGMELNYISREDRDDDDVLSTFETMLVQDIVQLNPFLEELYGDWDREGGETEWSAKYVFKLKGEV